jgi:hypothetical protein
MRLLIIASLAFTLASCASTPAPPTTVSAADPNAPLCHRETPTGSNVWHTVCVNRSADTVADNQRAVSDMQDRVQHSPAVKAGNTLSND